MTQCIQGTCRQRLAIDRAFVFWTVEKRREHKPPYESLADITSRIHGRSFTICDPPSHHSLANDSELSEAHLMSHRIDATSAPWLAATTEIPAEVFLENMEFFTPLSKRIRGLYTKEKVLGERIGSDGHRRLLKVDIVASHGLELPITSDLDYYRAFLKILADTMA
jgi:hypothetical protein